MNNGKVRIYELSRELDIENKDVLAICDRLNISAKSHSSTITEQEAARIRTAAENYVADHNSSRASSKGSSLKTQSKGADKASGKKQQILAVRRNRSASPPKPPTPPQAPEEKQPQSTAPAPSPTRAAKPEMRLNVPNRPAPSSSEEMTEEAERPQSRAVEAPNGAASASKPKEKADSAESEAARPAASGSKAPSAPAKPAPKLIRPPSRPSEEESQDDQVEEPAKPPEKPAAKAAPPPKPSPAKPKPKPATADTSEEAASPSSPKKPAAASKPVPELKRPPRPPQQQDEEEPEEAAAEAIDTEVTDEDADQPRLRRPTPRPKRTSRWEEDEEEDLNRKPSKSTKAKRRAQPIIEDDEEEQLEELSGGGTEDRPAPAQVSFSLARPPKPKSSQSSKPAATAAPQRNKRPSPGQRDGSGRGSNRRDRREEEVNQRPEKLVLSAGLTVHELADEMKVPETEIIKALFFKGIAANINQTLDIPTATMVAEEFDIEVEVTEAEAEAKKTTEMLDAADLENLHRRPPVVTIMGHVDHGKTTLLDSIRKTKVAQGEAGGITQHIGAYHVDIGDEDEDQKHIVFLDTPGHEAFTAMRARGARVTDIAILVVAADDGVRPQTIEAIRHAQAAEVPIVVAINKVDKEEANPDRVKQELMEHGLVPEEWGGEAIMVPVSAIKGENLDDLLEMIALVAEVEDLMANPNRTARGTVIEAHLDKARGPVASLLVQNGTLRVGDSLVAGAVFGKVRAMIDDRGNRVEAASPSYAVEVLGLNDVPAAGDEFEVYADEKTARSIADERAEQQRQSRLQQAMASRRVTLNTLSAQAQEGELKELNLILKADVQGSVEAILGSLQQLPQNEVQVRVLLAAPGEVSETDVDLAAASNAVIIGFNTTLASGARRAADEAGVDVREYYIIYKLLEDIQGAMEGLLEPELVEEPLGQVEVRAVFQVGRGAVAGCYVQSGKAIRNCRVRVRRGGDVVYEGNLDSLKRVKDDVKEVNAGFECGIGIDSFNNWEEGDIIETYRLVTKRRTLAMT